MADAPFDVDRAQRWFAVEFNNRAWDLVEKPVRSADEAERMIHMAHAACIHWLHVGNVVNHARAQCLLATAYAAGGIGEPAVRHAEKCLTLCDEVRDQLTEFDWASAYGCAANAHRCMGNLARAREYYQRAVNNVPAEESDELKLFNRLYPAP